MMDKRAMIFSPCSDVVLFFFFLTPIHYFTMHVKNISWEKIITAEKSVSQQRTIVQISCAQLFTIKMLLH